MLCPGRPDHHALPATAIGLHRCEFAEADLDLFDNTLGHDPPNSRLWDPRSLPHVSEARQSTTSIRLVRFNIPS